MPYRKQGERTKGERERKREKQLAMLSVFYYLASSKMY